MPKIVIFVHFGPGLAGLFGALLVDWWLWRAGCISQDTYLLYLTNILLQFSKLKSDLESSTQRSAKDPTGFNSWAGGGVASSILPSVKENPFAARMKVLEAKVASMEAQHRIDNVKMRALESKVASMDAQHRIDNAKMRALESKMASIEAWIQELNRQHQ